MVFRRGSALEAWVVGAMGVEQVDQRDSLKKNDPGTEPGQMGWAKAVEVKVALQNGIITVLSLWSREHRSRWWPPPRPPLEVLIAEHRPQ